MSIAGLNIAARILKQVYKNKWMTEEAMVYIYSMKYYSYKNKNKLMQFLKHEWGFVSGFKEVTRGQIFGNLSAMW